MSDLAIAPYVTAVDNPTTTAFTADGQYNPIRRMDPLNLEWEALKLKKKGEALTDPITYIGKRNAAITTAKNQIYQIWTATLKDLLVGANGNDPVPEREARAAADTLAKGLWKSKLAEIDILYPLNITEEATTATKKMINKSIDLTQIAAKELGDMKLDADILKAERKEKKRKSGKKGKK